MRTHLLRPNLVLLLACSLAILLFLLSIAVPSTHLWGSFLLPIVLIFLWGRRRDLYIVAALASVLVFAEYWIAGANNVADLWVNHLAPILILWGVAWLLDGRRRLQEELARREQELDAKVTVRTAALAAREQQLAKIFDANPGGIAITRQSDGCFVEANDAYLAMVGYTRGELLGRSLVDLGIMSAAARDEVRAAFRETGSIRSIDLQIFNARGEPIDIIYSLEQINFDGEPCYLGLVVDVTERRAAARDHIFLSALVASSPDAVVGRTVDGTILSWNHGAERLFGYTAAEAIGQNLTMLAAPGSREQMAAVMAEVALGNAVEGVETQRITKDGRIFDCQISSFPVRDAAGVILGVASFTHDISKRKAAERALRVSEERFARLFNSSPVGLALTRLSDGLFREVNAAFAAMIGYSHEEIIGRTSAGLGIISHEDRARLAAALQEQGSFRGTEIELRTRYGELLHTIFSIDIMDFDGEPWMLSSIVDFTGRKRLEDQLRDSEERFRLIVQNSPDVIALYNEGGQLIYISPAVEVTHGFTAAHALAADSLLVEAIVTPPGEGPRADELARVRLRPYFADRRKTAETVAYCLEHPGVQQRVEISITLPSGEVKYFDTAYRAHLRTDGSRQVVTITRDITERRRLEDALAANDAELRAVITELKHYQQLLQDTNAVLEQRVAERTADLQTALADVQRANRLKDEFMAMISHELRTPLTGVISMSEMLEEQIAGPLNDRQIFYVKGIIESGDRLLSVINSILGYTHLLSGKVELERGPVELGSMLDICAVSQQHKADARRQTIAVEVAPPDLMLAGDATAIAEVLKRLLDNAIKFTPEGGQVGLAAQTGRTPRTVDLVVWDTGIGIAEGQLEHILKPFAQADGRLSRSHEGIGMGLAYVDQMVRLMGGTITIESTPGAGSCFTITLPA